jgi:glycerol-3-phosphate dehydrogenase
MVRWLWVWACGLAGLGDLFVTYRQGRNQTLGRQLGQGLAFGDASAQMKGATVEGVEAVRQSYLALQAVTPG